MNRSVATVLSAVAVTIALSGCSTPCPTSAPAIGCSAPDASSFTGRGQVLVEAYGELDGHTEDLTGDVGTRPVAMRLDRVRTIAGPQAPRVVRGWLTTLPHPSPTAIALVPGQWAPNGHLLAVLRSPISPSAARNELWITPVVRRNVVFTGADCFGAPQGLKTAPFRGELAEVPGSYTRDSLRCSAVHPVQAPLDDFIQYLRTGPRRR